MATETYRKEEAMTVHYHWGHNIPGYMPMSDEPNRADDWESACTALRTELDIYVDYIADSEDDREGLWESATDAFHLLNQEEDAGPHDFTLYVASDEPHDLGLAYWVIVCADDDCAEVEE